MTTTTLNRLPAVALLVTAFASTTLAQLSVPSDGSDGVLHITANSVTDLGQATTGSWNANNSANAGNGVYDSTKWAVVFKYSSVTIDAGATNTFINHKSHAPVVWLVKGDVTINGVLSLNGATASSLVPDEYAPTEPGPGGFRGGALSPLGAGSAYGFGTAKDFGNPQIIPLIGASGGSGGGGVQGVGSGSGGGGAILIVASGDITVNGTILAKGGPGFDYAMAPGASGSIRLVARFVKGVGYVDASASHNGYPGRTRIECQGLDSSLNVFPNTSAVPPGVTPIIWPSDNAPTVRVTSVDSQPAPTDPVAAVAGSADIGIQNNSPVDIILETKNLPIQGTVSLRLTPKYGAATSLNATFVSGDINTALWKVTVTPPAGFFTLQARATAP